MYNIGCAGYNRRSPERGDLLFLFCAVFFSSLPQKAHPTNVRKSIPKCSKHQQFLNTFLDASSKKPKLNFWRPFHCFCFIFNPPSIRKACQKWSKKETLKRDPKMTKKWSKLEPKIASKSRNMEARGDPKTSAKKWCENCAKSDPPELPKRTQNRSKINPLTTPGTQGAPKRVPRCSRDPKMTKNHPPKWSKCCPKLPKILPKHN